MSTADNRTESPSKIIKLLLLGESNVGKTSIINRYADGTFSDSNTLLTVGIDTKRITRQIGRETVRLQFWDTAGQQKYRTIPSQYLRGIQGIILVYDISENLSFERIQDWLSKIEQHYSLSKLVLMLVGNKCDRLDKREVTEQEALSFAVSKGMSFKQTSAKTSQNIEQMVKEISSQILSKGLVQKQPQIVLKAKGNQGAKEQTSCCA